MSSVSHYCKPSNLKIELWEPSTYSQLFRSVGDPGLKLASEVGGSLVGMRLLLVGSALTVDNECQNGSV